MLHRYSRWDGSQAFGDLDADDVLDEIADDVLSYGDLKSALQRLLQQGMRGPEGTRMPGLKDLLDKLRAQKAQRMQRYDLGSSLEDIAKKLDDVVKTERAGIERGLQGRERERRRQALEQIPPDAAGRLRELQNYEFHDEQAEQKFQDLLASLRAQAMQPFMQGMKNALGNLTPEDLRRMREMIQDLNRMLRERAEGGEPDFAQFKAKWGSQFPGAESLDDVLEQIAQRMAQMQSLMQSLSPEQRAQLDEMTQRYRFRGDEQVGLEDAMRLMEEMQQLDALERELRGTRALEDLDRVDPAQVEKLAGEEARRDLERLQEIAKRLKDAGYLEGEDDDLKLTARAIRKIADKALRDIFARLKRDRFGGHQVDRRGAGGDQTDESKRYEFGDPFLLDLKETVMRALGRRGPGTPVRLVPDDFAVIRTEQRTQAATVVMLDMSRSMLNNGYFLPAKKVALALSALIRSQFPRDALYIVGFSLYAREFTTQQLPTLSWSEWNMGTNMHAGFMLSRRLLARHAGGNRQILMVTDGEPTAHLEGEVADFSYPPTPRTVQETLREVQRCTRERIIINTFMLERSPWLTSFVEQMARINRGRAFFATPDRLGEYLVVDYVSARRRARGA